MKAAARDICDLLYERNIRFISGKWFHNDNEIKDINKYLYKATKVIRDSNDCKLVINTFIDMYGENGWWPELPIIKEARELVTTVPPCVPLSDKQLKLIHILLDRDAEFMFILCGVGGSGKSTFANLICQIFEDDTAALTLEDLSNDFMLAEGVAKRLIYADELNSSDIDNGQIKTLISKQMVQVNPKNKTPYQARWQSPLFASCNKAPKLDLSDTGIIRRIVFFNMNTKIKNPDPKFQKQRFDHSDLVNIVRLALDIDMTNWFDDFKQETRDLLKSNNSVWLCQGKSLDATDYKFYSNECNHKGLRPFSEPKWKDVKELLMDWEYEEIKDELPF